MDALSRVPAEPEQLPVPPDLPLPPLPPSQSSLVIAPAQLWTTLPPVLRDQCRQTLVHILQEVVHDAQR